MLIDRTIHAAACRSAANTTGGGSFVITKADLEEAVTGYIPVALKGAP